MSGVKSKHSALHLKVHRVVDEWEDPDSLFERVGAVEGFEGSPFDRWTSLMVDLIHNGLESVTRELRTP